MLECQQILLVRAVNIVGIGAMLVINLCSIDYLLCMVMILDSMSIALPSVALHVYVPVSNTDSGLNVSMLMLLVVDMILVVHWIQPGDSWLIS